MLGLGGWEAALIAGLAVLVLAAGAALGSRSRALVVGVKNLEQHRPVGAGGLAVLRSDVAQALRHVAVVRCDAFGDTGGRLSFSPAIIDAHGDGLVIRSFHARGERRSYAKGVVGGDSDATLTPEEQQALAAPRTGKEHP